MDLGLAALAVSVVGLAVSVGGFWITLEQLRLTKIEAAKATSAAESAATAAQKTAKALAQSQLLMLVPSLQKLVEEMDAAVAGGSSADTVIVMNRWHTVGAEIYGLVGDDDAQAKLRSVLSKSFSELVKAKDQLGTTTDLGGATKDARLAIYKATEQVTVLSGQIRSRAGD